MNRHIYCRLVFALMIIFTAAPTNSMYDDQAPEDKHWQLNTGGPLDDLENQAQTNQRHKTSRLQKFFYASGLTIGTATLCALVYAINEGASIGSTVETEFAEAKSRLEATELALAEAQALLLLMVSECQKCIPQ